MRNSCKTYVIAVAYKQSKIYDHWEYIQYALFPQCQMMNENQDDSIFKIVKKKIIQLATEEEVDDKNYEMFHRLYDYDLNGEKLITSIEGTLKNKNTALNGIIFITSEHILFSSDRRYNIHFKDIISLKKDDSRLLSKSINIKVLKDNENTVYNFTSSKRNNIFSIIETVWKLHIDKWREELIFDKYNDELSKNQTFHTNIYTIEKWKFKQQFQETFKVNEEPIHLIETIFILDDLQIKGDIFFTKNYMCYTSTTSVTKFVINRHIITEIELLDIKKVLIKSVETNDFCFFDEKGELYSFFDVWKNMFSNFEFKTDNDTFEELGYSWETEYIKNVELQYELTSKWNKYLTKYGNGSTMIITDEYESLLRDGVPDIYRRIIWKNNCGAVHNLITYHSKYSEYLEQMKNNPNKFVLKEIEKDVYRSLPKHPFFQKEANIDKLRRVLMAYAARNPHVGYCQGMNTVTSILLLYLNEQEAFWVLVALAENILSNYYNKDLFGTIVDQNVFCKLLSRKYPRIQKKLDDSDVPVNTLAISWFMCIFMDRVPWQSLLRIIDLLLYYGTRILFRVGLGIYHLLHDDILKETYSEMIPFIIKENKVDEKEIIDVSLRLHEDISNEYIQSLRTKYKAKSTRKLQKARGQKYIEETLKKFPTWNSTFVKNLLNKYIELGKGNPLPLNHFRTITGHFFPNIRRLINPESFMESKKNNEFDSEYLVDQLLLSLPLYNGWHDKRKHFVSSTIPNASTPIFHYDIHESGYYMYNSNSENKSEYWSHFSGKEFLDKIFCIYDKNNDDLLEFIEIAEVFDIFKSDDLNVIFTFCKDIILQDENNCSIHQLYEFFLVLYHLVNLNDIPKDDGYKIDIRKFAKSIFDRYQCSVHDGNEFKRIEFSKVEEALKNDSEIKQNFESMFPIPNEITPSNM